MTELIERTHHFIRELFTRMRIERETVVDGAILRVDGLAQAQVVGNALKATAIPMCGQAYYPVVLCITNDPLEAAKALVTHCMAVSFAEATAAMDRGARVSA